MLLPWVRERESTCTISTVATRSAATIASPAAAAPAAAAAAAAAAVFAAAVVGVVVPADISQRCKHGCCGAVTVHPRPEPATIIVFAMAMTTRCAHQHARHAPRASAAAAAEGAAEGAAASALKPSPRSEEPERRRIIVVVM
jgi:hypothetical protein